MSTTSSPIVSPQESSAARFRHLALGALLTLVLLLPKVLNVRRDPGSWMIFRILLALGGASLVILPLSLWNSWTAAIAGLAMFLAAILLPAAKPDTTLADTASRLGALAVVNGGSYQPERGPLQAAQVEVALAETMMEVAAGSALVPTTQVPDALSEAAPACAVQLFVCADRIWVLDGRQHPLLVIPSAQILSAIASESSGEWIVRVRWAEQTADFHYRGIFAERLARLAEATLAGIIQPVPPEIPKTRAAGA